MKLFFFSQILVNNYLPFKINSESIAKNIVDVTFFVEKYNCWEWIGKEKNKD